jgi:hypothetical protein
VARDPGCPPRPGQPQLCRRTVLPVRLEALDAGAALRVIAYFDTGGICSPASTAIGSVFSGGASEQVANPV